MSLYIAAPGASFDSSQNRCVVAAHVRRHAAATNRTLAWNTNMAFEEKLIDLLLGWLIHRRTVRVRVHRAIFVNNQRDCFFLNVTNLSKDRDIEVTHIWFDCQGTHIPVMQRDRQLPVRLRPDESWETWIDVENIPEHSRSDAFTRGRVRLSTGSVVKSKWNKDVPPVGQVPGGRIEHI